MRMFVRGGTDLSPHRHSDEWRRALSEALVPLEIHLDHVPDYPPRIVSRRLGPIRITDSRTGPGRVRRTCELIRQGDPAVYLVGLLLEGSMLAEQDGRQAQLGPGDIALFDPSRPTQSMFTAMRSVAVTIPRPMMPISPDEVCDLTAVRITNDDAAGVLAATVMQTVAERLEELTPACAVQVAPTIVDLLTVALSGRLGRTGVVPPDARRGTLVAAIYDFIEGHLPDRQLAPDKVAAAHHISLRHLHNLFADQPVTVAGWIRRRRLERCRHDLLDPNLVDRPVNAIAAQWGLINATQFSRAFRVAYGLPPGAYRAVYGGRG